jgi:ABC-type phosphate transport system auxiliary subunit
MANNAPLSEAAQEFMTRTSVFLQDFEVFSRDFSVWPNSRSNGRTVTKFDEALEKLEKSLDRALDAQEQLSERDHDHPRVRRRNQTMSQKADALHVRLGDWLDLANRLGVREQLVNRHRRDEN